MSPVVGEKRIQDTVLERFESIPVLEGDQEPVRPDSRVRGHGRLPIAREGKTACVTRFDQALTQLGYANDGSYPDGDTSTMSR